MAKHIKNGYFPWMDGIYGKSQLDKSLKGATVDSWEVYWSDDPTNFYGFSAYIIWKSTCGKYGYDYLYYYSFDDTTICKNHGPFSSFAELKSNYEKEGIQFEVKEL